MAAGLRCGGCRLRGSSFGGRWRWCGGMLRSAVRVASWFPLEDRRLKSQTPPGGPNPGCRRPHKTPTSPGPRRRRPQETHGQNGIIRHATARLLALSN